MVDKVRVARVVLGEARIRGSYRGEDVTIYVNPRSDGGVYLKVGNTRVVLERREAVKLALAMAHSVYAASADADVLDWAWSVVHGARTQQGAQPRRRQQQQARRQPRRQRTDEWDAWEQEGSSEDSAEAGSEQQAADAWDLEWG